MRKPPRNPPMGPTQPCSIQQTAAHASAELIQTPTAGWPVSFSPKARNTPWAGKYFETYTGRTNTWSVSKNSGKAGAGFTTRPDANVSPIKR